MVKGLSQSHYTFLYEWYLTNPSHPLDGYVEEFRLKFELMVDCELICQWFQKAGQYFGSLRQISTYQSGQNNF